MTETKDPRLVEAEIIEKLALADKARAEIENLKLDKKLKAAEVRQKIAHAVAAEHGAESMRIQTEATQRQERVALTSDYLHNEYHFWGLVGEKMVGDCLSQLIEWHRIDPECDMQVTFTSPGGEVTSGMVLFDQVSAFSTRPWDESLRPKGTHRTVGVIRGEAMSMAGILIQAFDERVMGPEATLMVHEVSSNPAGSLGQLKDYMDHLDKLTARVKNIFVERSGGKITSEQFQHLWERKGAYLDSEEALKYGLVDRIG